MCESKRERDAHIYMRDSLNPREAGESVKYLQIDNLTGGSWMQRGGAADQTHAAL